MQFWQFLGDLHPRLVQFPLVLLLAGLLFDAAGLLWRSDRLHFSARILSMAGTFILLLAFICGIYAEIWAGRAGIPQEQIEWHELMANIASWGFVVLMAWRLFLEPRQRKALAAYTLIGLGWYSLLVITGYLGGKLVFDYGAAVTGAVANSTLSLHDLNVLATRQTQENLDYSEMMHHIFGWLTLVLSVSLFAHALYPRNADKLKWVGPALLAGGGVFLFFFADLDLYPNFLDPWQLRDREVQLHKTLAIVLVAVGVFGIRRIRRGSAKFASAQIDLSAAAAGPNLSSGPILSSGPAAAAGQLSTPSKVVAVMALIGGGMLFTHVHTVAPYANVAAGVYIAHITLGLVALGIGAARLLQDALPRWRRGLAVAFAGLMCIESILLITYNEGLPWYIGYGDYKRDGSHNGTIAPYGNLRAELTCDPSSGKLDLYVLNRFKDTPVEVSAASVNLLVSRGYSEMAIPLLSADGQAPASHFQSVAPALRNIAAFCARAALPIGSAQKMGYFDPWVTDLIKPVPPNLTPKYQCPMHDGIISETPGVCPLCGMPLVPYQRYPRPTLHDANYDMTLGLTPAQPQPGREVLLRFTPLKDGKLLRNLAVVHEHLLHLIITSADLSYFDHVHPVMQSDGSLELRYRFPRAGTYVMFADTTPSGQRSEVFRLPVEVGATAEPSISNKPAELALSPALAKELPGDPDMTAQIIFLPRSPSSGLHTQFLFRLYRNGLPVNDLEKYIGAMGHCVIISADTQTYLHCHPEQLTAPGADARGGPDVGFHTIFPRPGRYKIWGQFKRGGKVIVADFVVDIPAPFLPPGLVNFLLDD